MLWTSFFLYGMCLGGPTVFIPQIRKEANSTEAVSDFMASMLSSIFGYSGVPWVIILPVSAAYFGRKIPYVAVSIVMVIACTVFYTSKSVTQLLISHAMEGILGASLNTISMMVLTEYTSPKYRGFFLTFKSASFNWGIWVSNTIGTFFHWKYIGLVQIIISIYPLIVVFFWPESPYWLASKEKYDKCAESHRCLKGNCKESEKELERLLSHEASTKSRSKSDYTQIILTKEFYKATLLCLCVQAMYTLTGKLACAFYVLDILKKMASNESTAYSGMLVLDGVTVLAMYIGTILSRFVKRRSMFLFSSFVGIGTLFVLSLHVYLVSSLVLPQNGYISIVLLSIYSMGIGCGPMIWCSSLYAELLPLNGRSLAMVMVAISERLIWGIVIQQTPTVIRSWGLHSAFLIFGISSTICFVLLFFYMPETKDKSLHEIADAIKGLTVITEEDNKLNSEDE